MLKFSIGLLVAIGLAVYGVVESVKIVPDSALSDFLTTMIPIFVGVIVCAFLSGFAFGYEIPDDCKDDRRPAHQSQTSVHGDGGN